MRNRFRLLGRALPKRRRLRQLVANATPECCIFLFFCFTLPIRLDAAWCAEKINNFSSPSAVFSGLQRSSAVIHHRRLVVAKWNSTTRIKAPCLLELKFFTFSATSSRLLLGKIKQFGLSTRKRRIFLTPDGRPGSDRAEKLLLAERQVSPAV